LLELKKRGSPILNSANRLKAFIDNHWTCHDDILINVEPDGTITKGCYVKNRGKINCDACGFTPVAEASGALDFIPGSIYAGWRLFFRIQEQPNKNPRIYFPSMHIFSMRKS